MTRPTNPPAGVVVPLAAEPALLDAIVAEVFEGAVYRLFDGHVTPGLNSDSYSYSQHEVTWPGYGPISATGWGSASIGADSYAVAVGPALGWTFHTGLGDVTVGGAWATDAAGNVIGGELVVNGPVVLSVDGSILPYTPVLSLRGVYGSDST